VLWDGSRFVAVGTESVLVSAEGVSWERLATLDGYYIKDVAFNGELYVAVGWHGLLLTSPDGIGWTRIEVDPDERTELTRVRWLGGRFVVLGRRNHSGFPGVMLSSEDGVDWSALREFPDNALRDIAFDGARWLVAANQAAYISDDFEEWTEVELPGQLSVITATHGAGLFVAAGWPFAILTSPDGENWQIRTISNRTVATLRDVVWTGERFVVVGNSLFDSADGLEWQEVEPDHWVALDAVAWGMDRLVAVGAEAQRGAAAFSSRCEAGLVQPEADFGWSPEHYTPGEPVFFTDDSTGEIDRRQWDFGGGWYSFTSDPSHVFDEPWARQVRLWVEGPGGSDEHGDFLTSTVPPPPPPSKVVPAAAHTDGLEGTRWRTDLYVVNPGIFFDAEYELVFLPQGEDNSAVEGLVLRLGPRRAARYQDVVAEVLGATGAGALRLDPKAGPLPVASTRTFNSTAGGSYGQGIPARLSIEALGSRTEGRLSHLRRTAEFRSNIGFVNLSGLPIEVMLELHAADGGSLGTLIVELEPWSFDQLTDVLAELGTIEGAYAVVSTQTPDGRFLAYASVVDNSSGDPMYVPVVRWP
jgi:PKD repeat protein